MDFFPSFRLPSDRLEALARAALAEDGASGDVTVRATLPPGRRVRAALVARQAGICAGLPVVRAVYRVLDRRVTVRACVREGGRLRAGQRVVRLSGPARSILSGERTALNFLQRLSGIATMTRRCVDAVRGTGVEILHTRKTTPLLRLLERWAVRMGGGRLHRGDLRGAVLIKENHLAAAGARDAEAVRALIRGACARAPGGLPVEVEVQDVGLLPDVLEAGVDIVMFDNLPLDALREGVRRVRSHARRTGRRVIVEASGGMTLDRLRAVARTGVDAISIGAITHSAPALDYSLDITDD